MRLLTHLGMGPRVGRLCGRSGGGEADARSSASRSVPCALRARTTRPPEAEARESVMEASALFALALGVFLFALVSKRAEAGVITAPMVFTAFGFLVGGGVLDVVDLPVDGGLMHDLAEITLVVALFTDAARIDLRRLGRQHDVPIRLLAVGLPLTMVAGTGAAMLLFPDLGLWPAAVLAVILAPTDAALGQAVVSDERVPERVRQALNVESGLNDGVAFPRAADRRLAGRGRGRGRRRRARRGAPPVGPPSSRARSCSGRSRGWWWASPAPGSGSARSSAAG